MIDKAIAVITGLIILTVGLTNNLINCCTDTSCPEGSFCDKTSCSCVTLPSNVSPSCSELNGVCCSADELCDGDFIALECPCCIGECVSTEKACINAGMYYCNNVCQNIPCCSKINSLYCITKEECVNAGNYWCVNDNVGLCLNESCPVINECIHEFPEYCLTKDSCVLSGNYWCVINSSLSYCQKEACPVIPSACNCPNGYYCNVNNPSADFNGCVLSVNDNLCLYPVENCLNSPRDCSCKEGMTCSPYVNNADNKGCVPEVIKCVEGSVCIDGVCSAGENCLNSKDCVCSSDSFCNASSPLADKTGCVLVKTNELISCPAGYYLINNSCVLINKTTYSCTPPDNCLNNPYCKCAPNQKCNPKDLKSDFIGCVIITNNTCTSEIECCGNHVCNKGECNSCPSDCSINDCSNNNECNLIIGENCVNSNDCSCSEGFVCNINSEFSDKKGCVKTDVSVCGNKIIEKGETEENCCIDVGCSYDMNCIPKSRINLSDSFNYYKTTDFVCVTGFCGNRVFDEGENEENCCIDVGCSYGKCVKSDFDKFECVDDSFCGNGIKEGFENAINCCVDAGCPNSLSCINNSCVSTEVVTFECDSDDDCACFDKCGVISKSYGLTNPVCDSNFSCSNVLPSCVNGYCKAKLVSVNDNPVIDYASSLVEVKLRLLSFNSTLNDLVSFSKAAINYYQANNNQEKEVFFNELLSNIEFFIIEYNSVLADIDDSIIKPSEEQANYVRNRIKSLEESLKLLLDLVLSISVDGVSVNDLVGGVS